jgi:glycosyltransferase involved in cell wall biosynthesis
MKILHISTQDYGGAGIAAYRLHKAMQKYGLDSKMLVLNKKNDDDSVIRIMDSVFQGKITTTNKDNSLINTIQWYLMNVDLSVYPNRPQGLEIFTGTRTAIYWETIPEIIEADIIHLHWVFGIFDYKRCMNVLKNKKIVWTLHDMNPFTGGCHYTSGCEKYKQICSACPQLGSNYENDLSNENFITKKSIYEKLNISIVSLSNWLYECSSSSALFKHFKHFCIKNTHPKDVFFPLDKIALKNRFNLPDKKIILFGAETLTSYRKGIIYFIEAINHLKNYKDQFILGLFGSNPIEFKGFETINFGTVSNPKEMAVIYNLADIFVIPSLEDNLPNTVAESLLCGTPVVGFSTGGIKDMVEHLKTGYLVDGYDSIKLAEGIKYFLDKNSEDYQMQCRNSAIEMFDERKVVEEYLRVYEK